MLCKPGEIKTAPLFALIRATGHSAMAECLHSALKIIAAWILNVLVPWHVTIEKQKQWANTAAWWIFMSGEKPIDAQPHLFRGGNPQKVISPLR